MEFFIVWYDRDGNECGTLYKEFDNEDAAWEYAEEQRNAYSAVDWEVSR